MAASASNHPRKKSQVGEPTVLMVSKKNGSVHACLISAVSYAFQNGYELKDPKAYDALKKGLKGEADDGQIVRPEGSSKIAAETASLADAARAEEGTGTGTASWSEAQRRAKRRPVGEVVRPDGS